MTKRCKDRNKPSVFGVGFFGYGQFRSRIDKKRTPAYSRWQRMLERCYCPKYQNKKPTYKGCTVCDEWLNFQAFAEWFYINYPKDGGYYVLDKDIKVKGNKVYSPDMCKFVTQSDNSLERNGCLGVTWAVYDESGKVYEFSNQAEFAKEHGLYKGAISRLMRGLQSSHKGFRAVC